MKFFITFWLCVFIVHSVDFSSLQQVEIYVSIEVFLGSSSLFDIENKRKKLSSHSDDFPHSSTKHIIWDECVDSKCMYINDANLFLFSFL